MNFGEILTKAWKIIWKHKILWIFGILTSCGQGNGSNGGNGANASIQYSGGRGDFPPALENFFENLETFFVNIQGWEIAALILGSMFFFLILAFVFTALRTIGRIGLIQGTVLGIHTLESEQTDRLNFISLFNRGKPFFWRIFGFNLLAGIAVFILILLLLTPVIAFVVFTFGIGFLCLLPLLCLLIPAGWLVSVLFEQVNIAIVVEDLGIFEGLQRGWEVLRDNIGNLIIMGLILVLGGFILNIILALPMISVVLPIIVGVMGGGSTGSDIVFGGGLITSLLCCAAYVPVLIVLSGILQAFIKTAWTATYLEMTKYEVDGSYLLNDQETESDQNPGELSEESE